MAYTHEQQLEMLRYAKKHGVKNASRHFGVSLRSLAVWNKKYNVYPVRLPRQYTTEQKYNILGAVIKYGLQQTAKMYNVTESLISVWNDEYNIYPKGQHLGEYAPRHPYIKRTADTKLEILKFAKKYGTVAACEKYDVSPQNLANWRYRLGFKNKRSKRNFSPEHKSEILAYAAKHSVARAAQYFDINSTLIRIWIKKQQNQNSR